MSGGRPDARPSCRPNVQQPFSDSCRRELRDNEARTLWWRSSSLPTFARKTTSGSSPTKNKWPVKVTGQLQIPNRRYGFHRTQRDLMSMPSAFLFSGDYRGSCAGMRGHRTRNASRFPGVAGYTADLLHRVSRWDEDGFSSCSTCPCHRAAPNHPAGVTVRFGQPTACHATFAPEQRARPPVFIFFRGHYWVHVRCGPLTRSPSRRWLCRSASSASFPPRMRPKLQRFLTVSSGGTVSH
jgi:hypothetical protein